MVSHVVGLQTLETWEDPIQVPVEVEGQVNTVVNKGAKDPGSCTHKGRMNREETVHDSLAREGQFWVEV